MSTKAIQSAIADRLHQAEVKRREAEILEAEARGLKSALDLMSAASDQSGWAIDHVMPVRNTHPSPANHLVLPKKPRAAGRQPGALSNRWKRRLLELRDLGNTFSFDDVVRIVMEKERRSMRASEARRLFEKWQPHNHIVIHPDGRVSVPNEAAERFKATLPDGEPDADDEDDEIESDGDVETGAPIGTSEPDSTGLKDL